MDISRMNWHTRKIIISAMGNLARTEVGLLITIDRVMVKTSGMVTVIIRGIRSIITEDVDSRFEEVEDDHLISRLDG